MDAESRASTHSDVLTAEDSGLALSEHEFDKGVTHLHLAEVYTRLRDLPGAESSAGAAVRLLREGGRPHWLVEADPGTARADARGRRLIGI